MSAAGDEGACTCAGDIVPGVEWLTAQPGAPLGGQVRAYTGYRVDTSGPAHRWETPAGELNLIVSFGDGFRAQAVAGAGELSSYTSFVAGMHDRPSRTAHDGRQLGIQIRLDPLGAFSLFGVPLHELGNRVVELAELLGPDGERWAGQLLEARTWEDRFALLDRLLTDRIAAGSAELTDGEQDRRIFECFEGVAGVGDDE